MNNNQRIYRMPVSRVYPMYIEKAEKKGRVKVEVDEVIRWLMGYSQAELEKALADETNFDDFFAQAPKLNANRVLITGVI